MKYRIIVWILFQTVSVLWTTDCPKRCACSDNRMECTTVMPDFIPSDIRKVTVNRVSFENVLNFSDPGWINVTHLSMNPKGLVSAELKSNCRPLYPNEFSNLTNLDYLKITCDCCREISKNTFYGLNKLRVLDLSNNILNPYSILYGLIGEGILPRLEELYISNITFNYGPFSIGNDFLDAVRNKTLKVLDISKTNPSFPTENIDLFHAFEHLETINMSKSGLTAASLALAVYNLGLVFPGFQNLRTIDFSYPSIRYKIFIENADNIANMRNIHFTDSLSEVYARNVFTNSLKIVFLSESSKQEPNARFCTLVYTSDNGKPFESCFVGNFYIEILVLSENSLRFFDPILTRYMNTLRYLDLSKNNFGDAFSQKDYVKLSIANLPRLQVFIVSENRIAVMPDDAFEVENNLEILDLSHNELKAVTFKTGRLLSLQTLDLSFNKIMIIEAVTLDRLTTLKMKEVLNTTRSMLTDTNIIVTGNPIDCECENRQYIIWALTYNNIVAGCRIDGDERAITEFALKHADFDCKTMFVIAVFSILTATETAVISALAYFIIREIKAARHRKKINSGILRYREGRKEKHTYPVFLSFCSEDDEIVMGEIYPLLDKGLRRLLATDSNCVATGYNNFRPGFSLANEIIRCIEESSVVVLFVTNAFCKKMWCRHEAIVAHYENKPMILMIWEELDLTLMPKYMYHHYQEHARVHWIQENGRLVMKPDWDKICEAIVSLFAD